MAFKQDKLIFLKDEIRKRIKRLLKDVEKGVDYLYEIATTEEKTGLYNYRFFKSVLGIEFERVKRTKKPLSIMILDLDYFKKVNDTYGHLVGDRVLFQFAKLIVKGFRKSDTICRFGGEEFMVLMPNTTPEKAKKAFERVKRMTLADSFLKKHGVTFSAGIASYKKNDKISLIKSRADKALYLAKKNGRNRCEAI